MRLPFISGWQDRRDDEWWARIHREHRWSELAAYNDRVSKGVVHTPEYVEKMRCEQMAFDAEPPDFGQQYMVKGTQEVPQHVRDTIEGRA